MTTIPLGEPIEMEWILADTAWSLETEGFALASRGWSGVIDVAADHSKSYAKRFFIIYRAMIAAHSPIVIGLRFGCRFHA